MRAHYSLQNVTVMFITDGVGSNISTSEGKTATSFVCPYTHRRYDVPKNNSYRTRCYEITAINRMIRDARFKIFNLFIGDRKSFYEMIFHLVPNTTLDSINEDIGTPAPTQVYPGLVNYDEVIFTNAKQLAACTGTNIPSAEDDESASDVTAAQVGRDFIKSMKSSKQLAMIGDMIVSRIVADFKIIKNNH